MKLGFLMRFEPERLEFARKNNCQSASLLVRADDLFLPPHSGWSHETAKVKEAFRGAGLEISCLGSMYKNILDPAKTRELALFVRASIELAKSLGVSAIGCFAGRVENEPLENSLPAFKKIWGELGRFAADHGVRIAFENCPGGPFHLPPGGINLMCTPEMWERAFNELPLDNLGLEWDPSHLVCQFTNPVDNLKRFGKKVFHVHAKDARVNRANLARYGIYHRDSITHCFPGLGDSDWKTIINELKKQGYTSGLDIEGQHDPVYHGDREDEGLLIAIHHLAPLI